MRRLLALLALTAAVPLAAQPVLPDSADLYVKPILGVSHIGSQGSAFTAGLDAGRSIGGGFDAGLRAYLGDLTHGEGGSYLTVGPSVGYSRRLPGGLELDARALATATLADLGPAAPAGGFGLRVLEAGVRGTVSKPYRVVGSLELAPVLGAYGTACSTVDVAATPGAGCAEMGALAGLDIRFRVLGADVALPIVLPIRLLGNDDAGRLGLLDPSAIPSTGGIRIRF